MKLADYGWDDRREHQFAGHRETGHLPARTIAVEMGRCRLVTETGELVGEVSGRFRHEASDAAAFPAVGDWLAVRPRSGEARAVIDGVLERRTSLSRKIPGRGAAEQVAAANVDLAILVMGLDRDFNLRRAERYLSMILSGGARPLIALNKADLCHDPDGFAARTRTAAGDVPVCLVSAVSGTGVEALKARITAGRTAVFIGSSGAGKSTLTNRLLGAPELPVGEVRSRDGRGRHTTTRRELFLLPGGGMVIDTPGLREIQAWDDPDGAEGVFGEIDIIAAGCRFRDCSHQSEPGCAIHRALGDGSLEADRFESFLKLKREASFLESRKRQRDLLNERRRQLRWKGHKEKTPDPRFDP